MGSGNCSSTNLLEYRWDLEPRGPNSACCLTRRRCSSCEGGSNRVVVVVDCSILVYFSPVAVDREIFGSDRVAELICWPGWGDGLLRRACCWATTAARSAATASGWLDLVGEVEKNEVSLLFAFEKEERRGPFSSSEVEMEELLENGFIDRAGIANDSNLSATCR